MVGDLPLTHEECAIVTVNPPIFDNLRVSTLEQIVELVNDEAGMVLITKLEISILGVGIVTCTSAEIRDLLVRESPHQLDDDSTYSSVRHDEGINMRLPVFNYEAWILFLAFPPDYLTEHYINRAVSLFGKLIL